MRFGSLGMTALAALVVAVPVRGQDDELAKLRAAAAKEKEDDLKSLPERVSAIEKKLTDVRADSGALKAYWKEGLYLESADKKFKFQLGGRLYVDAAWINEDNEVKTFDSPLPGVGAISDQDDYFEFRAARLFLAGTLYERVEFKAEFDFADGPGDSAIFKDVYIGVNKIPWIGNFRVGHFKEPFSLEELTSSRFITFMERATPNAFAPGRNTGAMIFDTAFEERLTWAAGIFRDADNHARDMGEGEYAGTFRLTGLPWFQDATKLWHVGAAFSTRRVEDNAGAHSTYRVRQRPETHGADRFVDTGTLDQSPHDNRLGLETALVYGSWSLQGEYLVNWLDRRTDATHDDLAFDGWYVFGGFFVTGEGRNYKKSSAAFDRVKPLANFMNGECGTGAIELAVRYSNIDLIDQGIDGGEMNCLTLGVNWYLNPMTRVMLNYINADVDHRGVDLGDANIFMMRFQVDF